MSIKKGTILDGKYTYGWECCGHEFYEVMDITSKGMATLRHLKKEHRYYPGPDGKIYYNTPEEVFPTNETAVSRDWRTDTTGPEKLFKRKIYNFGTEREYVKTRDYEIARVWSGKPEDVWNWH